MYRKTDSYKAGRFCGTKATFELGQRKPTEMFENDLKVVLLHWLIALTSLVSDCVDM